MIVDFGIVPVLNEDKSLTTDFVKVTEIGFGPVPTFIWGVTSLRGHGGAVRQITGCQNEFIPMIH